METVQHGLSFRKGEEPDGSSHDSVVKRFFPLAEMTKNQTFLRENDE